VADAIAQDKGNTYRRLQDLVSAGKVKRDGDWYTAI
jgi:DNA-binding IclR family transcriptional regulator